MKTNVSIVKCGSYDPDLVFSAVKKAVELAGGIENFIKPGSKVLVKPNLLMAKEPESGIDTHPEIVRSAIKILKGIGCKVLVGDGPSVWGNQVENVQEVYSRSGVKKVCLEENVSLVEFDKRRWRGKFPITSWLDECDHLVSLPKFKTHDFTILTGAIKNLFGLVPGTYKTELHKKYFSPKELSRILLDIYEETKPSLTIVDGITAMEGDGPATGGTLRQLGLVFAGKDCVALDSILAAVMGLAPHDIYALKEAAKRSLGVSDLASIEILGEKMNDVIQAPFKLPATSFKNKIPQIFIDIAAGLIKFFPEVDRKKCILCQACLQACPGGALSVKKEMVFINQAKCISCFCCQEACPQAAIKVKKSIFARAMGL